MKQTANEGQENDCVCHHVSPPSWQIVLYGHFVRRTLLDPIHDLVMSVAGLYAEAIEIPIGLYSASKYGLRALGTELRHEMTQAKLPIKITNISPAAVLTEIMLRFIKTEDQFKKLNPLQEKDIADAVVYALGTPERVEIHEVTVTGKNGAVAVTQESMNLSLSQ